MRVLINRAGWLSSGTGQASAQRPSSIDTRAATTTHFLAFAASGESAIFTLQASVHGNTADAGWFPVGVYTATTTSATAAVTGYYPYLAAQFNAIFSGGAGTGFPQIFLQPGTPG